MSHCLPFRSTWVHLGFRGVRVTRSSVLCVCFVDRCLFFVLFLSAIVLSVLLGHCVVCSSWPLCCRFFLAIVLSVLLGHCVVCSSSIYGLWLPLWYFKLFLNKRRIHPYWFHIDTFSHVPTTFSHLPSIPVASFPGCFHITNLLVLPFLSATYNVTR